MQQFISFSNYPIFTGTASVSDVCRVHQFDNMIMHLNKLGRIYYRPTTINTICVKYVTMSLDQSTYAIRQNRYLHCVTVTWGLLYKDDTHRVGLMKQLQYSRRPGNTFVVRWGGFFVSIYLHQIHV